MKRTLFPTIMIWIAAACAPTPTQPPVVEEHLIPTQTPVVTFTATSTPALTEAPLNSKLPETSFESQTYINEEAGFALDYPVWWTVRESIPGERAKQIQFLSTPEIADSVVVPRGTARVTVVIYQWEPKNDLPAFVANWKTAWDSSGFTILEEQPLVLDLGLNAVQFLIRTPDSSAVVLITALEDQYLVLSGEGNRKQVKEILQHLRPLSP